MKDQWCLKREAVPLLALSVTKRQSAERLVKVKVIEELGLVSHTLPLRVGKTKSLSVVSKSLRFT